MLPVLVLLALVVLRVVLLGALAFVLIPRNRRCPACGAETAALERTGLVRLLPGIARRWCVDCGWSWYRRDVSITRLSPRGDRWAGSTYRA